MKRIVRYLKKEKEMLILISVVLVSIIVTSILVTLINDQNESDTIFWLEVVLISFLINLLTSLLIIAFFDDRTKQDELEKRDFFLTKITICLSSIATMFINLDNKATNDSLNTIEKKKEFLLKSDVLEFVNAIKKTDLSKKDAPYIIPVNSSNRNNMGGNWLEYYFDTLAHTIKYINTFKEILIQYISEGFYECLDTICQYDDISLNSIRKHDFHVINDPQYQSSPSAYNENIHSLSLIEPILLNLRKANDFLLIESKKKEGLKV